MANQDKPHGHGGRRHGLSKQGRTPALVVRVHPSQRTWLANYAEERGVTQASVIRWLIGTFAAAYRVGPPTPLEEMIDAFEEAGDV